jgi:hypothetical protein
MFVSTFHSVSLAYETTWKIPSLEVFIESLRKRRTSSSTWKKSKAQRCMHLLCKMVAVTKIRNLKTKTKGRHMKIQRRKGTQNPSTIPLDLKVEREENGRNVLTSIKDSI